MTTVRVISKYNGKSVRELRIRRLPGVSDEDDDIVLVPGRDNQISDVLWVALISDPKFVRDFVASGIMTVMSS